MGLATVYRNLRVLQQQGRVRCRHLPSGELLYSPLERDVHHLTCLECGTSQPLSTCPVEQQGLKLPTPEGFQPLFHTLEVFGYCARCKPE
jgi:Fur family ferric uptake transcriptional regulator